MTELIKVLENEISFTTAGNSSAINSSTEEGAKENALQFFIRQFSPVMSTEGYEDPLTVTALMRARHGSEGATGSTGDVLASHVYQYYQSHPRYDLPFALHREAIEEGRDSYRDPVSGQVVHTAAFLSQRHAYVVEQARLLRERLLQQNSSIAKVKFIEEKIIEEFGCKHSMERHCPHTVDGNGSVLPSLDYASVFDSLDSLNGAVVTPQEEGTVVYYPSSAAEGSLRSTSTPTNSNRDVGPRLTSDMVSDEEKAGILLNISHHNSANHAVETDEFIATTPSLSSNSYGAPPPLSSSSSSRASMSSFSSRFSDTPEYEDQNHPRPLSHLHHGNGMVALSDEEESDGDSLNFSTVDLQDVTLPDRHTLFDVPRPSDVKQDGPRTSTYELGSVAQREQFLLTTPSYAQPYLLDQLASREKYATYRHPLTGAEFYTSYYLSLLPHCFNTLQIHCPHGDRCHQQWEYQGGQEEAHNPTEPSPSQFPGAAFHKEADPVQRRTLGTTSQGIGAGVVVKANTLSEILQDRRRHRDDYPMERQSSESSLDSYISKPVNVNAYDKFDYLDFAGL